MLGPAIARFLGVLATLGQARHADPDLVELLKTGALLITHGTADRDEFRELAEQAQTLVDHDTELTDAQRSELRQRRHALVERALAVNLERPPADSEPDSKPEEPDTDTTGGAGMGAAGPDPAGPTPDDPNTAGSPT